MKGQWLGVFKARFDGTITIELDQQGDCYEGWAYLFYDSPKVPCASAYIKTNGLENEQTLTVPTFPLNPFTGVDVEWDSIKKNFDGVDFAKSAEVKISFHNSNLEVSWKTDLGGEGTAVLNRSFASQFSTLDAQSPSSWAEFKTIVSKMVPRQNIFRGQNKGAAWRLRTSFHRTGRYNLRKFLMNDIDELHRSLVNVLPNRFNLSDPDDKGSFVALVQHHGYPTPLLDWSYSPYIAAFFAFEATNSEQSDEKLRVFVFDEKKWD